MYLYNATVVKVVDGDTVDLDIDLGFYMKTRQRIRLANIDAPEMRGKEKQQGKEAKAFLKELLLTEDNKVQVETVKTGKFGRWLGVLYLKQLDHSVNAEMIDKGHAEIYR